MICVDPKINGIVIILTRWHQNDLAGQLLKLAEEGGERWRVVSFPMEAEKEEIHELNGNVYRLRNPGEILFPERMPREFVEKCKQRGSLVWNALSAESIYRFALDSIGAEHKGVHPSALKSMVEFAISQKSFRKPKPI